MGTNPSRWQNDPQNPVERVNWYDCQTFINQLNALTGMQFRLPTEAEWEFAARGGNKTQGFLYAGNSNIDMVGWYSGNAGGRTHAVANKQANELGLFDMTGNVSEWVQDWYAEDYYSNSPVNNPTGPETGTSRVDRGGNWYFDAFSCRVAHRYAMPPTAVYDNIGFRLAL